MIREEDVKIEVTRIRGGTWYATSNVNKAWATDDTPGAATARLWRNIKSETIPAVVPARK